MNPCCNKRCSALCSFYSFEKPDNLNSFNLIRTVLFFAVEAPVTLAVMPEPERGGGRDPTDPPIFGQSANPFPIGKGRLSPSITTGTPNIFHLLASLN